MFPLIMAAPYTPEDFRRLIIQEDDSLCTAFRNLTALSVMFWSMVRYKYKPDGTGFTEEYLVMLQAALESCPDPAVPFDGETPKPQDFKNLLVGPTSSFCEKFVKLATNLSQLIYDYVAFEYNWDGTDFSDEFKALLCGVDCGEPPEIDIQSLLNYRNFLKWDVVQGEVDLIGIAPYNPVSNGVGMYVDLAGTDHRPKVSETVWNGTIRTKSSYAFPIVSGNQYRITYFLAGHNITAINGAPLSNTSQCRVRLLRADGTQYESVDATHSPSAWNMPFTQQTVDFTAGSNESAAAVQLESNVRHSIVNVGPKIDNVQVTNLTTGMVIFSDDFEDEFLGRDGSSIDFDLPDPDDSKAAIPTAELGVCEKFSKIVLDFPRNVYDVISFEYKSGGSGFSPDYKFLICNPVAVIDPEEPVEEENGLLNGLQAYFKHDEASGDVLDAHGGHDLTEHGGTLASVTPGALNTGRVYGTGEIARAADDTWNEMNGESFTIIVWLNPATLGSPGDSFTLFSKQSADGTSVSYKAAITQSPEGPLLEVNMGETGIYTGIQLTVGEWTCIVVRYDAAAGNALLGTVQNGEMEFRNPTGLPEAPDVDGDFILGGEDASGIISKTLQGAALDEVAVWKRCLSDEEVNLVFNSGTPLPYSSYTA